jgi:DNA-binding transcriptional LysR family regulator
MHFRGLDLNLLVALDALLEQGSVTAAGRKVHLSQSAMSCALGRLRRHFGDPLLVSIGRRMEPTPYARQLAAPVRSILLQIDASLKGPACFEPGLATRRFTIAASDYATNVLLLAVQRHCANVTPQVVLEIMPVTAGSVAALNRGEIDLLILPDRYRQPSCPSEALFSDRLVCVVARDNRLTGSTISLQAFKSADHVVFQPDPQHVIAFDTWLREHYRFQPKVKLYLSNYALLPQAVVDTARIATIPARLAREYVRTLPVRILEPLFRMPPMIEILQWHAAHADDAGLQWLRQVLHDCARALGAPPSALPASVRKPAKPLRPSAAR